jgi:ABC-2 type transport system permease protein
MEIIGKISTLLFITILFNNIPLLGEWSLKETLVIYGLCLICRGIYLTFFGRLEDLGSDFILDGNLDKLLVKPISPLFSIISEKVNEENLTEVLLGIAAFVYALSSLKVRITLLKSVFICFSIVNGVAIYFSFFLIINCISFWYNSRFSIMWAFMELSDFSQYPMNIFKSPIRSILTWIIPFALTSYYPACFVIDKNIDNNHVLYFMPVITIVLVLISCFIWKKGLKKYESVGN